MTTSGDGQPSQNDAVPGTVTWSKDDRRWEQDRLDAEHTRLARVQSSANVWLGILGTLFGLTGTVVLVKGSTALVTSTRTTWLHWALITLVALAFVIAILALMMGGAATWGGLANPAETQPPAHRFLDSLIRTFGSGDSKKAVSMKAIGSDPPDGPALPYEELPYRERYKRWADRRRAYLHYSRGLGVVAASLAAAIVVGIFVAGTLSQASPDVIVVHKGRVTCGTTKAAEGYSGVTQVISVAHC